MDSDAVEDQKLIGGNPTGIVNLNNVALQLGTKVIQMLIVRDFWITRESQYARG